MRPLLLFLTLCVPWPVLAEADGLAECAAVESALERLDCFDRLARERLADDGRSAEKPPAAPSAPAPVAAPARTAQPAPAVEPETPARFGLKTRPEPAGSVELIEARIDDVRTTPLGEHVMTLSNGQVWMENEPGRRPIAAGQDVIIRKHRWHYEMELAAQPDVAVRRID